MLASLKKGAYEVLLHIMPSLPLLIFRKQTGKIMKFVSIIDFRLWNYPLHLFDSKLNLDHVQQCLIKVIREKSHDECCTKKADTETVAEFEAFYILVNLGELYQYYG